MNPRKRGETPFPHAKLSRRRHDTPGVNNIRYSPSENASVTFNHLVAEGERWRRLYGSPVEREAVMRNLAWKRRGIAAGGGSIKGGCIDRRGGLERTRIHSFRVNVTPFFFQPTFPTYHSVARALPTHQILLAMFFVLDAGGTLLLTLRSDDRGGGRGDQTVTGFLFAGRRQVRLVRGHRSLALGLRAVFCTRRRLLAPTPPPPFHKSRPCPTYRL